MWLRFDYFEVKYNQDNTYDLIDLHCDTFKKAKEKINQKVKIIARISYIKHIGERHKVYINSKWRDIGVLDKTLNQIIKLEKK